MPVVHNRGKILGEKTIARKIVFPIGWDDKGNGLRSEDDKEALTDELLPGKHKKLTDAQYKHLKELFPDEIVNVDDVDDMKAQFKEKEDVKAHKGYLSPEEVDAEVDRRVKEKLAQKNYEDGFDNGLTPEKVNEARQTEAKKFAPPIIGNAPESKEKLTADIDALDRSELIALIERETIEIPDKQARIKDLKTAIFNAIVEKYKMG